MKCVKLGKAMETGGGKESARRRREMGLTEEMSMAGKNSRKQQ